MTKKRQDEKLLDHDYDGIQELDNPLPRWWLYSFYASIVFSVFYVGYYHLGNGKDPWEELEMEVAAVKKLQEGNKPANQGADETLLAAILQDKTQLELGHKIFGEKCASCHGPKGEGQIGPNLTDRFWIHGDGGLPAIFKSVAEGIPDKGMPPWKALMKPDELNTVVAYLKTLEGTNVANGKAPQGTEVKEN